METIRNMQPPSRCTPRNLLLLYPIHGPHIPLHRFSHSSSSNKILPSVLSLLYKHFHNGKQRSNEAHCISVTSNKAWMLGISHECFCSCNIFQKRMQQNWTSFDRLCHNVFYPAYTFLLRTYSSRLHGATKNSSRSVLILCSPVNFGHQISLSCPDVAIIACLRWANRLRTP